jgi:hypothetical protein
MSLGIDGKNRKSLLQESLADIPATDVVVINPPMLL